MNRNVTKGDATKERLVEVATDLFGEHGYEATAIESVLRVGRGEQRLALPPLPFEGRPLRRRGRVRRITCRRRRSGLCGGSKRCSGDLANGGKAWIRLAGDPVVQRILLIDAPVGARVGAVA